MAKIRKAKVTKACLAGDLGRLEIGQEVEGDLARALVGAGKAKILEVEDPTPGGLTTASAGEITKRAKKPE